MPEIDQDRERFILDVLRRVAKQRVAVLLEPGDVWVIEHAVQKTEDVTEALLTCHMRGWLEPISHAVPTGSLTADGQLPANFQTRETFYRLTDSGWNAIHRTHWWGVFACLIALVSMVVSMASLMIALMKQ